MSDLFIGLISGTSMDGVDAAAVRFGDREMSLIAVHQHAYPETLTAHLRAAVASPSECNVDVLGELDARVGECFRDAAIELLAAAAVSADDVRAIGSHGQTIRHRPDAEHPFTLQIGNPSMIAAGTGIDTIADFRSADMALGGEGAPLVPPFHAWLFHDGAEDRVIVNVGGIANITVLPADGEVIGFDTGPGNALLDAWTRRHEGSAYDEGGQWAASGSVDAALLERMLADPWFTAPAPKSTGLEYFNMAWLENAGIADVAAVDVQATLAELTAASITAAIAGHAAGAKRLLVCGGGAHNADLLSRMAARLQGVAVETTASAGLDPDWVEACAFAWLAKQYCERRPGNLPSVTGARRPAVLGALYPARPDEKRVKF